MELSHSTGRIGGRPPQEESDVTANLAEVSSKAPPKEEPARGVTGAPRRKVLAAGAGGGLGGNLAVILAYHFPQLPEIVVAAYTSIFVTALAVGAAYLVPERDKGEDQG